MSVVNQDSLTKEDLVLTSIEEELACRWFATRAIVKGDVKELLPLMEFSVPWMLREVKGEPEGPVPDVGMDLSNIPEDDRGTVARMIAALKTLEESKKTPEGKS